MKRFLGLLAVLATAAVFAVSGVQPAAANPMPYITAPTNPPEGANLLNQLIATLNASASMPPLAYNCTASGATPQTCNGLRGIVTTNSLSTAAATNAAYVINDSSVTAASLVDCQDIAYSGTLVTNGYPTIMSCVPGAGTITVNITNTHAANALSGTVQIGFKVWN